MSDKNPGKRAAGEAAGGGDSEETFLARWSRLKTTANRDGETIASDESSAAPAVADESDAEETGAPELTDADMPPVETLHGESDVSGFLSKGVSEGLRRAALRKLFHSPKFNVCDGLDDYCEDFTNFAPLGATITADMRHHMERLVKESLDKAESLAAEPEVRAKAATVEAQPDRSGDDPGDNASEGNATDDEHDA